MDTVEKKETIVARIKLFIWDCIHGMYLLLLAPRKHDDEERRIEFILNIILCGTIIFLTYLECLLLIQRFIWVPREHIPYTGVPILLFSSIYLISLSMLCLSRKGLVKTASYGIIAFYFFGTTYSASIWGPYLYQVLLSYALIIVIASILLKEKICFFLTLIIAVTMLVLSWLHIHHVMTFDESWKLTPMQLSDTIKFSVTYGMIVFVSWLSNREIVRSLARARHSEDALREKNESLEMIIEDRTRELHRVQAEKVSQLSRFAEFGKLSSGMFHDLMNPLTTLSLHVEELRTLSPHDADHAKENIEKAIATSKRIESFIGSVRRQMTIKDDDILFSLNDEIEGAVRILDYPSKRAAVTLKMRMRRQLKAFGDPSKFHQVITNIIANAIDACDDPAVPADRKTIIITMKRCNGQAQIVIRDQGCGISPAHIEKIFEPFFSTKSPHRGIGIGLSNVKDVVANLGGTITIHSTEHAGTTFTITIPLAPRSRTDLADPKIPKDA